MKIEKIQKTKNGKYKIALQNEQILTTYDDVILEHGLLYHPEIDENTLKQLQLDTAYYDLYHKVVSYILKRLRSEKEIREYLYKLKAEPQEIDKIITNLKTTGLVNDKIFTHAYIYDKLHLTNIGPKKIEHDLEQLGIESTLIKQEIDKIEEDLVYKKIEKIISKKIKNNHKYSSMMLKEKLLQELSQLGYDYNMIQSILETVDTSNNLLEKEFEKIYTKYSKKYTNIELKNKIKQKLYQKGYELREIESLLENINT